MNGDEASDRPHEPAEEDALAAVSTEEGLPLCEVCGVEPPAAGTEEALALGAEVVAQAVAEDGADGGEPDQATDLEDVARPCDPGEDDQGGSRHQGADDRDRLGGREQQDEPVAPHRRMLEHRQEGVLDLHAPTI